MTNNLAWTELTQTGQYLEYQSAIRVYGRRAFCGDVTAAGHIAASRAAFEAFLTSNGIIIVEGSSESRSRRARLAHIFVSLRRCRHGR